VVKKNQRYPTRAFANALGPGPVQALISALLFGSSTVLAKWLLGGVSPVVLAGLLYLGSGLGLSIWIAIEKAFKPKAEREAPLVHRDIPWLAGAIFAGGVLGPVLLMLGLNRTPATTASLLLNLEGVFTALLAWFIFRENFDRRIFLGFVSILSGGVLISWAGSPTFGVPWGAIAIAAACLCWGIDNNLTRFVSGGDPKQTAAIKGIVAGAINLSLGLLLGGEFPKLWLLCLSGLVGFFGYGVSLVFFIQALRSLGTARTGAYFSTAPFIGAALSVLILREPMPISFLIAGALMGVGVWLHLTEYHEHEHLHERMRHTHLHTHDEHHQHTHDAPVEPGIWHTHEHEHEPLVHTHPHYPDLHHRHGHRY